MGLGDPRAVAVGADRDVGGSAVVPEGGDGDGSAGGRDGGRGGGLIEGRCVAEVDCSQECSSVVDDRDDGLPVPVAQWAEVVEFGGGYVGAGAVGADRDGRNGAKVAEGHDRDD